MAKPLKHYGKWRIRWKDADGRRRSEVYAKYCDAELALARHSTVAEEVRRGLRPAPRKKRTFAELADYWMKHRAPRKRSMKDDESILRRHLRPAFGAIDLDQLGVGRVDVFVAEFSGSEKTLHNVLTLLIAMLNQAVDLGWLSKRPRIRKPQLDRGSKDENYLRTKAEIRRFLVAARTESELAHALYATAIYTGARQGELAALRWGDVDLPRRLITVQRSYNGPTKARDVRHVPILDPLLPILREWRLRSESAGGVRSKWFSGTPTFRRKRSLRIMAGSVTHTPIQTKSLE